MTSTRFLDGPAAIGHILLSRAPLYLRVAVDRDSEIWPIDRVDDSPRDGDKITVYERVGACGESRRVSLVLRGGERVTIDQQHAAYKVCEVQPIDADARDNTRWAAWVSKIIGQHQKAVNP
jgi:hypothetical protein